VLTIPQCDLRSLCFCAFVLSYSSSASAGTMIVIFSVMTMIPNAPGDRRTQGVVLGLQGFPG
jgi:hypothetical protein